LRTAILAILVVAGCSAPDKPILRGKLDLPVAQGDTWKLCADDGMDDTTPNADCVLAPEIDPMKGYRAALVERGWTQAETAASDIETWERASAPAGACGRIDITGVGERFAAKMYTLLRFELKEGPCVAADA
jgi:hypothetical protein